MAGRESAPLLIQALVAESPFKTRETEKTGLGGLPFLDSFTSEETGDSVASMAFNGFQAAAAIDRGPVRL